MVTMVDVAVSAGVSTATVSHVLNGTRFVKESTRLRVLEAIDRTGYTHNTVARSLAASSTKTIGLAMAAISNPYFIDLVHAIETEIRRAGYSLLLADTLDDAEEEFRAIRSLHQRRVDGYLIAPSCDPDSGALDYLADRGLAVVLVDRLASDRFDQVGSENIEAASLLVEHLAANNHRRIALVSGPAGLTTTLARAEGFRLGMRRSGLAVDEQLLITEAGDPDRAAATVHQLMSLSDPPTAILAANNRMTIGAMKGFRGLGLEVPRDIALVSFDDFEWADLFRPRLTVVAQRIDEIGRHAVRLLLERIADPARAPQTIELPPRFIHRESCGCPDDSSLSR
ncbi:LacI family DNA-binding transcriptional regulator [Mycolicibacterium komossense]|uniref:LacI family DNA-binding transcriptional regulator n=1 Tax=Mycolicibacterium komossense TaxID=1779 RepID=A0ABT3C6K5_9MYCO|nr:LacI family DNA-binding transcriptional regulator [Mycolicibacterium komossense]MCV7225095.1 LacI family DNA-binding transcriptional regulator [Mycolicibacterium komossense]